MGIQRNEQGNVWQSARKRRRERAVDFVYWADSFRALHVPEQHLPPRDYKSPEDVDQPVMRQRCVLRNDDPSGSPSLKVTRGAAQV